MDGDCNDDDDDDDDVIDFSACDFGDCDCDCDCDCGNGEIGCDDDDNNEEDDELEDDDIQRPSLTSKTSTLVNRPPFNPLPPIVYILPLQDATV